MNQQKQPLDPKDSVLNVSLKKSSGQFIFLSKIFLLKFGSVDLHGLGEATKTVAAVAETLQRKYSKIQKYFDFFLFKDFLHNSNTSHILKVFLYFQIHILPKYLSLPSQNQLGNQQYATIKKIETQTYTPEQGGKKIKLIAKLEITIIGEQLIKQELQRKQVEKVEQQQESDW